MQVLEDEVPKQWVPPYGGRRRQPLSGPAVGAGPRDSARGASAPSSSGARPKEASSGSLQGLEQVLRTAGSQSRCLISARCCDALTS
jgi:hypothetical protein